MKKDVPKDFKSFEEFEGTLLSEDVTKLEKKTFIDAKTKQRFELKTIVYAPKLQRYVQLKKFDDSKLSYLCRVIETSTNEDKKKAEREEDIGQDDLTKEITVFINVLNPNTIKNINDTLTLKVNINDKISKISDTYSLLKEDISGFLTYDQKII